MQLFLLFLILSALIFLFCLHILAREDWTLIRKNVSMEQLFNGAIGVLFSGLLMARMVYILMHPNVAYFNILVFLLFPYFPGLSLMGGVLGGILFLFVWSKLRKFPFERIFDLFALAFFCAIPVGLLGSIFLKNRSYPFSVIYVEMGIYFLLFLVLVKFMYYRIIRGRIKDGVTGYLSLSIFSFTVLIISFFSFNKMQTVVTTERIMALIFFISAFFMLIKLRRNDKR